MKLEEYLKLHEKSVLNLGCGRICPPEHYGVDMEDFVGVDLKHDITTGLPFDDNTFDEVITKDILEHIPSGGPGVKLLEEIYRVLKPGGIYYLEVPTTDGGGVGAFGHPWHVSFWNKTKLKYFLDDKFTGGWRASIGVKCYFEPVYMFTLYNDYDMPYVKAELRKPD